MEQKENFLDRIPVRSAEITWKRDENNLVVLEIVNKGIFNRIAQKLFRKPPITYVHLDERGSFIWPLIDGEKSIYEFGPVVEAQFGEKAHPLYDRLAEFFRILESYRFISFK